MEAALDQARQALAAGEVPVGAVLVIGGAIVARRIQPAHQRERSDGARRGARAP